MTYKIVLTNKAQKTWNNADKILKKKLAKCFNILQENPRNHPQIKSLQGILLGKYRFRVGDYRVIYTIDDDKVIVLILLIEHRSKVYRKK